MATRSKFSNAGTFTPSTNFRAHKDFLLRPEGGSSVDWAGFLAGLRAGNQSSGPSIIRAPGFATKSTAEASQNEEEEPGILSRVFASLDAPQNFVMNTIEAFTTDDKNKSGWEEFGSDLLKSGKAMAGAGYQFSPFNMLPHFIPGTQALDDLAGKMNPANSVSKQLGRNDWFKEHDWAREGLGFLGDVATDPLTYIPIVGWGAKAAKMGGGALAKTVGMKTPSVIRAELEEVAARSKLVQPENIIDKAVRHETPTVKPHPAMRQDFKETVDEVSPDIAQRVVEERPFRSHLEDAAERSKTFEGTKQLDDATTSGLASEALGKKLATEHRYLTEDSLAKFGKPLEHEATEAVDTARINASMYTPSIKAGAPSEAAAASTHRANFSQFAGRAVDEAANRADNLTPAGNFSPKKAWESVVRKQRAADDHLLSQNTLKDGEHSIDFSFHGEPIMLSDVLARVPTPKSEKQFKEVVEKISDDFETGRLTPDSHPALVEVVRKHQAEKAVLHPNFMKQFNKHVIKGRIRAEGRFSKVTGKTEGVGSGKLTPEMEHKIIADSARKAAASTARSLGHDIGEAGKIGSVVSKHLGSSQDAIQKVYAKSMGASAENKVAQEVIDLGTKQVEAGLEAGTLKTMTRGGRALNVTGSVLGRFGTFITDNMTTWSRMYGLHGGFRNNMLHAAESAHLRNARGRHLLKEYTEDEIDEAFRYVQGRLPPGAVPGERAALAVPHVQEWFTHLMGETSASSLGRMGVAQKSGMLMDHVNHDLGRVWGKDTEKLYRLRNDKFTDETGREWDFTPGGKDGGWTNSWKAWPTEQLKKHRLGNPTYMMHDLDLAMERQARLYSSLADVGERYGRKVADKTDFAHQVDHPVLGEYYFPREVRDGIEAVIKHYEKGSWVPTSKFMKQYSKTLRAWKSGVTIYSPSHHERNFMGDMWLTWMAGHSSPFDFYRGVKVMSAFRHNYKAAIKADAKTGFGAAGEFTDPRLMAGPRDIILRKKGRMKSDVTASDLYHGAYSRGILPSVNDIEDIGVDGITHVTKIQPLGGHGRRFAMGVSEHREHTVRLHHFTAVVRKKMMKGKTKDEAMDEAADEVKKWHPDGTDLTYNEQKFGRNIIPFYSWQRKAIPLIIEGMITNPAKIVGVGRAPLAISAALGMQEENPELDMLDPFPDDHSYSSWLRAGATGPVGLVGGTGLTGILGGMGQPGVDEYGQQFGTTIINPMEKGVPFNSVLSQMGGMGTWEEGPKQGFAEQLNPALAMMLEPLTGHRLETGQEIEGAAGYREYAAEQIPPLATAARLFPEQLSFFAPNKAEKIQNEFGGINKNESLINWLTAMGLTGSGQYKKRTDIEKRDRASK